jgi:ABC-2 type transport system ATP-binding protein
MNEDVVIKVDGVSKNFILPHERANSLKSLFTGAFRLKGKRTFEVQHALKDVSFEVKKGEFFGIVGRNGSGKSTMLKMLAQIYQPNQGSVHVAGKLVPFIELGVGFNPELTGRENVYLNGALLGFTKRQIDQQYDQIVEFAELEKFMDQKLKNYSSGMQVRLAFSVATTAQADVLLIDEVLAVGDADFQRKCFDYFQKLKGSDTTVVFVTHDMNAVREYCDRAILIEKNEIVASGSASDVATEYTKMFIERSEGAGDTSDSKKRWGDGALQFTKIEAPKKLSNGEDLTFKVHIKANEDIKDPITGFLIKNASQAHILGTNNKILRKNIKDLKKGEEVTVEWRIPDVFNDGLHYIDPAVVYKGGTQVADWWEDAASFTVLKDDRTPYLVNPSIQCEIDEKD